VLFSAKAGFQDRALVRLVVAVRVFEKIEIRGRSKIDAPVAKGESAGEEETVREYGGLLRATVAVNVFEDFDAVAPVILSRAERAFAPFHYPQTTALIPGHRGGIPDQRFSREEAHLETRWHLDRVPDFLKRKRMLDGERKARRQHADGSRQKAGIYALHGEGGWRPAADGSTEEV